MFAVLFLINLILAFTIIFLERKDPSATLAWLLVLFLLPGAGIVFYIVFSQNISRQKIFTLFENEEKLVTTALKKQYKALQLKKFEFDNQVGYVWSDLIKLNQLYGESYYTQHNSVDFFTDGISKMKKLFEDLTEAKYSINVEYYIIKDDVVGNALIDILIEKAREGLEVRLLVDALGSRKINKSKIESFKKAGGKYGEFFPTVLKFFNSKINYRNHRKIVVIDDTIGYIGGFNIAKEYVGLKKKFGFWRDNHLRIEGSSVKDLNFRFMLDWRSATKENLDIENMLFQPEEEKGNVGIQIVSCGPERESEEIKMGFLKMISAARKSIYIQTPYFVPDEPILDSIKMAAQSGVEVNIMIPCIPDHMFVYWATFSYVGEIIKAGGNVYIYDNGFLHAKTIIVDGEICSVGSCNFDRRSFKLNFETNAFIYDRKTSRALEDAFKKDIEYSHKLTRKLYDQRGYYIKVKEVFSRMLSDIL